ncbi:MAG TPA: TIGR03667 family PPOX class F420-dependent oxidoreductase [Ktedonosporobacter sp.]|nr:TIGR03667 family PPOX class F420-dependent oxidoreductase [Ktedonosporobacter sp.]
MLDLTKKRDAHIDQRLRSDTMIWLNTVRSDGRPHSVAVWFLWTGEVFLIFSKPEQQKIRNIRKNAQVTLALDDTKGGDDVIVVEGTAELLNDPNMSVVVPAYVAKYGNDIKELGLTPESMAVEYSQGISITPTKFI